MMVCSLLWRAWNPSKSSRWQLKWASAPPHGCRICLPQRRPQGGACSSCLDLPSPEKKGKSTCSVRLSMVCCRLHAPGMRSWTPRSSTWAFSRARTRRRCTGKAVGALSYSSAFTSMTSSSPAWMNKKWRRSRRK